MNIVVFGANSAIAQAACRIWIGRGDNLFLIGRNPKSLQAIQQDLNVRAKGGRAFATTADLTVLDQHASLLDEAERALGSLDLVFIAHGDLGDQTQAERDFSLAHKILNVNLISPLSILTHAANRFENKKAGQIAVISSVAGDRGRASNYVYATAKGGVSIFLSGLRGRLMHSGVSVTDLKLGFVDTPMTVAFKKGALWATPEKVARCIVAAVDKKADEVYIPWFWFWIMFIIRHLPQFVFKRLRF